MLTVQVFGFRVLYIDCNHFPISLTLINHGKDPEHLHFDDFTTGTHLKTIFQFATYCYHLQDYPFCIKSMYTTNDNEIKNRCDLKTQRTMSQCRTLLLISQTSMGSLSPQQSVSPSLCAGSSHVCHKTKRTS